MPEKFTSEQLLKELPRPLLNFLWYLWDTYYVPCDTEFRITLEADSVAGQRFIIPSANVTITQDFGCSVNTAIIIRRHGTRVFMERD